MTPDDLRSALARHRLLAVLRGPDPHRLLECIRVLADNGVRLLEVSLTSTDALRVIARAATELPEDVSLGAGTVLTGDQLTEAASAGGTFAVTPAAGSGMEAALRSGLPVVAGALTPTEVWAAHEQGAAAIKLFPAFAGGPAYLKALREPFPDVPLVPVGGVDTDQAAEYLAHGALAVGVGSPLLGDAVTGGDLGALAKRARSLLEAVR